MKPSDLKEIEKIVERQLKRLDKDFSVVWFSGCFAFLILFLRGC